MSTYWYLECLDHDPPIISDMEFTQHTNDDAFRAAIDLANSRPIGSKDFTYNDSLRDYFDGNARRFLIQHPSCRLGLVNEYDKRQPLPEKEQS